MRSGGFDQGIPGFPQAWHADDEHMPQRLMAARLRVEQFKIGAFARQGGGQRQIVASRKSSPQVMMSKGGRSTLNARPSAVRNFGSAASSPAKKSTPNICSRPIRRFGSYPTVSLRPMVSNDAELYAPHTGAAPANRMPDGLSTPNAAAASALFSMAKVSSVNAPPAESPVRNTAFGLTG